MNPIATTSNENGTVSFPTALFVIYVVRIFYSNTFPYMLCISLSIIRDDIYVYILSLVLMTTII